MLTLLAKILTALNSESEPRQLSWAVAFAFLAGLNPMFGPLALVSYLLIIILRVNLAIFFATFALFSAVGVVGTPLFHLIGEEILTLSALNQLWTDLYQGYWFRIFDFNNTKVIGSALVSLIFFLPIYLVAGFIVTRYRQSIMAYINKFKVVQSLKASKFYRIYETVAQQ